MRCRTLSYMRLVFCKEYANIINAENFAKIMMWLKGLKG